MSISAQARAACALFARHKSVIGAIGLALLLAIPLYGCNRYIDHELTHEYDTFEQTGGSFEESLATSDPKPYEGSKVAHVSLGQDPASAKVRGNLTLNPSNSYGYYGGAFYFPPGTLNGPSPKQQLYLDVARWDYGSNEDEFGGLRIGTDHQVHLIKGQAGQQATTIGSPFSFQEGCWNWVVVYQRLTDDSTQRLNRVYLNGQQVVSADSATNWFGHSAQKVRFGAVSTDTGTQSALDFYMDKTFISNDTPEPPPTANACDPVYGGAPPPATVDNAAQTPVADATSFLYAGDFPSQHGVSSGTIDEKRGAVIEGKVTDTQGNPIEGVRATVVGHPEFGYTETHSDGKYHMAVNGGGELRVRLEKEDYVPIDRTVDVPWNDYSAVDDVVMTPLDGSHTVDLSDQNSAFQVVQGSSVTDSSGTRQATLLFPQGTSASMRFADGSTQPLDQPMKVHATELTVGSTGPKAMSAELPPSSGYTYAIDYSVDQAIAARAASVEFSGHKVISYTDDFLGMPVGATVPVGSYDSVKGAWISTSPDATEASKNGRVIRIISDDGNIAHLAVTSSNNEATQTELDELGITDAERQKLAQVYPNIPQGGKALWRVQLAQFSDPDFNWQRKPDNDVAPELAPNGPGSQDANCQQSGSSTIGCEDRVLGEHLDLTGSKFGLSYRSDRSRNHKASYQIKIPLTDSTPPASLSHVEVKVEVAGKENDYQFGPNSNPPLGPSQSFTYEWDGKDAFGRTLQGEQPATVSIGYSYPGKYKFTDLFADYGTGSIISGSNSRDEITIWRSFTTNVGTWDATSAGLGGWTLDVHHVYDPNAQTLYMGDGTRRSTQDISRVISTVAGAGQGGSSAEDVDAKTADISDASGVAVAPDGSVYYSDYFHDRVRRIGSDGHVHTIVGTFNWSQAWHDGDCTGDGSPASSADVNGPEGLDVGPDGSLYIADRLCNAIRRIAPDGNISTVAGVSQPHDVAVADDGTLFVAAENTVVRIDQNGGTHEILSEPPSSLNFYGVDVGADGSVYFTLTGTVQRLNGDGTITRVAGTGVGEFGSSGDGGPATQAKLGAQNDVAGLADGSFYIADGSNHRLRYVDADGNITRVAGRVDSSGNPQSGFAGDAGPARSSALNLPQHLALAPTGIYVADSGNNRVRLIEAPLPNFTGADVSIPSEDGSELYVFDKAGRHLRTVSALTGATLYTFGYSGGALSSVQDGDGNTTSVRPPSSPNAIIASFGQRTDLTFNSGLLASVTNPKGEQVQLDYSPAPGCSNPPSGLLSAVTDARSHASRYCYDSAGNLKEADDRGGGSKVLTRSGDTTTVTTGLGRSWTYATSRDANGDSTRTFTDPAGFQSTLTAAQDGTLTAQSPDNMHTTIKQDPDPRLGMNDATLSALTTTTPDGETRQLVGSRQSTPTTPGDPLQSQTDTLTVNGHAFTSTYTASTRRFTSTTPEGRMTTTDIDPQARPTQIQVSGIQPLTLGYDSAGRLQDETTQDASSTRNWHYAYKSGSGPDAGMLDTVTDPLQRTTSFGYDANGRVTSVTLPGNRVISFGYDANGNRTSITTPPRFQGQTSVHSFSFSPVDLLQDYTPPDLGFSPRSTTFEYDADHDLTKITRPDGTANGTSVTLHYSDPPARRLDYIRQPGNQDTTFSYSSQTGQLSSITTPTDDQIQFAYDGALPKRETHSGTISASASRTYNDDLRLHSTSVNDGQTVNYSYDNDGLLTGAGDLTLTRDPANGLLRATSMASGSTDHATSDLSYNAFGELSTLSASYGSSPLFSEQITQRDALGRIKQKVETTSQSTHTFDYTYEPTTGFLDTVYRDGTTKIADYGYDGNGNRLSEEGSGVTVTGAYDDQDRLTSYGSNTYTYTEAGDLKSKNDGNQLTTYGYDALGNLTHVTLDATGTPTDIDYVLDGFGRRIGKKVSGNMSQGFVYGAEALGPVAELDSQGNVRSRFVYASRSSVPDYMLRGGNTYRIITDHLGSPRIIVDTSSGQVAQELDYDEFGNVIRDTAPGFQPFGFAGGLYDRDTKLVRFGARDYDPEVGRWTARDPILFAGGDTNLYGYVLADPVNRTDASGLWSAKDLTKAFTDPWNKRIDQAKAAIHGLTGVLDTAKDNLLTSFCWLRNWVAGHQKQVVGITLGTLAMAAGAATTAVCIYATDAAATPECLKAGSVGWGAGAVLIGASFAEDEK